jgi:hypothetical protein
LFLIKLSFREYNVGWSDFENISCRERFWADKAKLNWESRHQMILVFLEEKKQIAGKKDFGDMIICKVQAQGNI